MYYSNTQELKHIIKHSENIAFFGGAGVSTESGIPDFRSEDGLYNQEIEEDVSPEEMLSFGYFINNTESFYKFYREKLDCREYEPNKAHYILAELERLGKLKVIVTQNIDGLHQKAGSENVYELHGTIYKNACMMCRKEYDEGAIFNVKEKNIRELPRCTCGGLIKPGIVLYGEALDYGAMQKAKEEIKKCDTLIVGGTSLQVYPANEIVRNFKGKNLVIINREPTDFDDKATLILRGNIGDMLESLGDLEELLGIKEKEHSEQKEHKEQKEYSTADTHNRNRLSKRHKAKTDTETSESTSEKDN